jgi:hypothetical protein
MTTPYGFRGHDGTGLAGPWLLFWGWPGTKDSGWQANVLRRYAVVLGGSDDAIARGGPPIWEPRAIKDAERNSSMAEITRSGPLAGVWLSLKLEAAHDMLRGLERRSMSKLRLGERSEDPQVHEQLIEAAEKIYGSDSYAELSEERDRCNSRC